MKYIVFLHSEKIKKLFGRRGKTASSLKSKNKNLLSNNP
jgi:predicted RNA-binding protein YlqC (UPF0109 family)